MANSGDVRRSDRLGTARDGPGIHRPSLAADSLLTLCLRARPQRRAAMTMVEITLAVGIHSHPQLPVVIRECWWLSKSMFYTTQMQRTKTHGEKIHLASASLLYTFKSISIAFVVDVGDNSVCPIITMMDDLSKELGKGWGTAVVGSY